MSVLGRLKAINATDRAEDSVPLRLAVLVAVMAAAGTLLQQIGSPVLWLAMGAGLPIAFVFSYARRRKTNFWPKVGLAIAVLVVFARFLRTVGGDVNDVGDLQVALAELFLWVQLLHSFDLPARRDLLFSLTSSLVLVAMAAVMSVSMETAPLLLIWAVAGVVALVLAHRSELGALDRLEPVTVPACRERLPRTLGRTAGLVAAVITITLVLGTGVFLLLPRATASRTLNFPSALRSAVPIPGEGGSLVNPPLQAASGSGDVRGAGYGYFGFSRTLDTALRGRPDDTLVMRVRAPAADFWRGQSFDNWDGRTWSVSTGLAKPQRVGGWDKPLRIPQEASGIEGGTPFTQTFYLEIGGPNIVFAARSPRLLYFPDRSVFQLPDGSLRAAVQLGSGAIYTVVSERPLVTGAVLRTSDAFRPKDPADRQVAAEYLQLPPSTTARVRAVAASITAAAPTVYDKVLAIESWLGSHTRYSLDVPPLPAGEDAVDRYLFVDRRGFCEQIGTSLVVMLRSLGVPARLAVGYAPGERNPFTGLFEVRARDAHAWAEVYFPGVGWQAFDPTAGVPLSGESGDDRASAGIMRYLRTHLPHVPGSVAWIAGAIVLLIAVAASLRWLVHRRSRRPSWTVSRVHRLEHIGAAGGCRRSASQTLPEYGGTLAAAGADEERVRRIVAALEAAAFSGTPTGSDACGAVDSDLDVLAAAGVDSGKSR